MQKNASIGDGTDTISVVVIVKNDPSIATTLLHLDRACLALPRKPEVIVVDASTTAEMAKMATHYGEKVRWLFFKSVGTVDTRRSTIPGQRNLGISEANGSIIVFIDSGCSCEHYWLLNLTDPIVCEGEQICVGGVRASSPLDRNWQTNTDTYIERGRRYVHEAGSGNMAVRKTVYEVVGAFDEGFSYGSDADFAIRAIDSGFRIRYVSNAEIVHDWGDTKSQLKRATHYAEARVRLYRKHPRACKRLLGPDFVSLAYPLLVLGLPAAFLFPPLLLVLLIPLVKNMHNRPFKTLLLNTWYGASILASVPRVVAESRRENRA